MLIQKQFTFTGNLTRDLIANTKMFFIIEEAKKKKKLQGTEEVL